MSTILKLNHPRQVVDKLELLCGTIAEQNGFKFSKISKKDLQDGIDGFKRTIVSAVQSYEYSTADCDAMISALKKAQNILDGKKADFENNDIFVKQLSPKTGLKTRSVLLESSEKGASFSREKFTRADHAYLRLTGGFYTVNESSSYRFLDQFREIYGKHVTPEFLAYRFFEQAREIYENPHRPISLTALAETLSDMGDICPKNIYPILYWAYKEAKHANADPILINYLVRELIREEPCEFRTEFQSSEEIDRIYLGVKSTIKHLPEEWNLESGKQPSGLIWGIFEAIYENRPQEFDYRINSLEQFYPDYVKDVRAICSNISDTIGEKIAKKTELEIKIDK